MMPTPVDLAARRLAEIGRDHLVAGNIDDALTAFRRIEALARQAPAVDKDVVTAICDEAERLANESGSGNLLWQSAYHGAMLMREALARQAPEPAADTEADELARIAEAFPPKPKCDADGKFRPGETLKEYVERNGTPADPAVMAEYERAMREEAIPAIERDLKAQGRAAHYLRLGIPDPARQAPEPAAPMLDEVVAKEVYEAMQWGARHAENGAPPDWAEGGNSGAQTEARRTARRIAALQANSGGVGELVEALVKCRDKFAEYVELHRAKLHDDTPTKEWLSVREKMGRNHKMVAMCDAALAKACPPNRESE